MRGRKGGGGVGGRERERGRERRRRRGEGGKDETVLFYSEAYGPLQQE